jgi:putative transposase
MTSKSYSQLVYHLVWATRGREPLISREVEERLVPYVKQKCRQLGYALHAVECVEDHVHLLLTLKPTDAVADVVKNLKGSSSHFINVESGSHQVLYWQRGYGAVTMRKRDIPFVKDYIERQKQHHGEGGGGIEGLERVD